MDHLEMAKGIAEVVMGFPIEDIEKVIANRQTTLAPLLADAGVPDTDAKKVTDYAWYQVRYLLHKWAQKRALPLLRRYLTPEQRRQLRSRSTFTVVGSEGGRYRLAPLGSRIARLVEINGRWYDAIVYCFHDTQGILPPADVMLGTMFHLMTDEAAFLAEANVSSVTRYGRNAAAVTS